MDSEFLLIGGLALGALVIFKSTSKPPVVVPTDPTAQTLKTIGGVVSTVGPLLLLL